MRSDVFFTRTESLLPALFAAFMLCAAVPARAQDEQTQSVADAARAARAGHAKDSATGSALGQRSPFSQAQLIAWQMAGVSTPTLVSEIKKRGITFPADDAHLAPLKDAQLSTDLLAALSAAPAQPEGTGAALPPSLIAASKAFAANDYATARHTLETLTQQNQSAAVYAALGNACFLSRDLPAAKTAFDQAAQLDPALVYAHVRLAGIHYRLEEASQAAAEARKALRLQPGNTEARKYLAQSLAMAGQGSGGGAAGEAASSSGGDVEDLSDLKGGTSQEAKDLNNQANEFSRSNDFAHAEATYRRAIGLDPQVAVYHYNLGALYARFGGAGGVEQALAEYRRAKELAPRNLAIRQNLGHTLCQAGRWNEAVMEFRELLSMDPTWNMARPCLVNSLNSLGRVKEAQEVAAEYKRYQAMEGDSDDN